MPKPINRQGILLAGPDAAAAIEWLTLAQWQARRAEQTASGLATESAPVAPPLGLEFQAGEHPEAVAEDLHHFAALAVRFVRFTDGRGLTTAQRLRARLGWQGPLWAVGDILRDQLFALARVGFDHFALRDDQDAAAAAAALADYAVRYQGAWDEPQPLWRRVARSGAPAHD